MSELPIERDRPEAAEQMPAWIAWLGWIALGSVLVGGLYLYAVRGTALILDMAMALCF